MTPERLARAISALREMSTYSADDLLCCLAEDPSTFQYVADLLASHDALTARLAKAEGLIRYWLVEGGRCSGACSDFDDSDACAFCQGSKFLGERAALKESK